MIDFQVGQQVRIKCFGRCYEGAGRVGTIIGQNLRDESLFAVKFYGEPNIHHVCYYDEYFDEIHAPRNWRDYLDDGGDMVNDIPYMRRSISTTIIDALGSSALKGENVSLSDLFHYLKKNDEAWSKMGVKWLIGKCKYLQRMGRVVLKENTISLPEVLGLPVGYAWVHLTSGSTQLHAVSFDDLLGGDQPYNYDDDSTGSNVYPMCRRMVTKKGLSHNGEWERYSDILCNRSVYLRNLAKGIRFDSMFLQELKPCKICSSRIQAVESELGFDIYSIGDFSYWMQEFPKFED